MAWMMYCDQNKGLLPADGGDGTTAKPVTVQSDPSGTTTNLTWDDNTLWFNALPPFMNLPPYWTTINSGAASVPTVGENSIYVCPSMNNVVGVPADAAAGVSWSNNLFNVWGAPPGNPAGKVREPTCLSYVINSKLNGTVKSQKIAQLVPPTYVVLMTEKRMSPSELPTTDGWYGKSLGQLKAEEKHFTARHHKGGHLLFVDGHVSWFSNAELQIPYSVAPVYDYNDPGKVVWDPFGPEGLAAN